MTESNSSDRVLPETRWVAGLVIPFLVAAFVILYFFPHNTATLFAWEIKSPMTAMMLGSAYAGGIYYFSGLLMTRQWHRIKVGLLPVTTFASVLSLTTILHWDKFNHGTLPFFAWSSLYFTTPFIVFGLWLRNRGQDTDQLDGCDAIVPQALRLVIGIIGVITLSIAIFLFLNPALMIQLWPWTLTPLTSRVMAAMFSLPGIVGLGMAMDSRWSSAQIILQSQGFSILLILIAVVRDRADFNWATPGSWLFAGGLGGMLAGILIFYAFFNARQRMPS
ncbi:MAG: hypothetical protein HY863_16605 [Chloroflexi bacterium]|nr:hypothetical protein [Chloroflexota bacterium]